MFKEILIGLVQALAIMTLLSFFYGAAQRSISNLPMRRIATGFILGLGALFAMAAPTTFADGVIVDGRTVFVGVAAAFGGVLSALVVVVMAGSYRLYIGGLGAYAGFAGIVIAALIGLAWHFATKEGNQGKLRNLFFLGAAIPLSVIAVFILPIDLALRLSSTILPILIPYSIMSTLIFGILLQREQKLVFTEKKLREAADNDFLTGLLNRRAFTTRVQDTSSTDTSISTLVILDLDHFKNINDEFGHSAGDQALIHFGDLLTQICRGSDTVARIGGEEFAVFMNRTNAEQAKIALDRILNATRQQSIDVSGRTISFTTSAGAVEFAPSQVGFEDAFIAADNALYQAKKQGRDRLVFDTLAKKVA
ncbi:GGDEF domain-containing protein [Pararhizobium sp. IMCC21322]|uniref:GGDEF domain-containing protein n=1 Tax=Pararhizobium sp. IMCC21322 TaxID=3067903 RepID=UPI0027412A17|nr:diguanylate cyclase [Pararhizobium sp. IMCC21322]